jgi:glycosyltransferase involved in cell wall biosynthesis
MTTIGVLTHIDLDLLGDFLDLATVDDSLRRAFRVPHTTVLCKELLKRGHRLCIFSLHSSLDRAHVVRGRGLTIHLGPTKTSSILNGFKEERRFFADAINLEKPSLLHAHWTYEYALAAVVSGLPHVVTAHDTPLAYLRWNLILNPFEAHNTGGVRKAARNNAFWLLRTLLAYRVARRAQRLVAVAPYVADHLRRFGFHSRPIDVIPNGVESDNFERESRSRGGERVTFADLGHWGRLKNGAAAIQAFAKVRNVLPHAALLMFGAGYSPEGPAAAWARQRGWQDGVEFRGQVHHAELMEIVARDVDVMVHPSFVEAHPLTVIEAMARGIPVIGGRTSGGVPWTLGEGKYGVLVNVRSVDAIADAMLELARDAGERDRLGMAGREYVRSRFDLDQVVDRYEAIYSELMAPVRSQP